MLKVLKTCPKVGEQVNSVHHVTFRLLESLRNAKR